MPKIELTPIDLAKEYLISIGINQIIVNKELSPNRFEDYFYCRPLQKSNIVIANKYKLRNHETHIYVEHSFAPAFYSDADIKDYKRHGKSANKDGNNGVCIFERNINRLLRRRKRHLREPHIQDKAPLLKYNSNSNSIINTHLHKWITTHNKEIQVHIGKQDKDGDEFKDFRLGLLLNDYLIMLKYKKSDDILAVGVPYDFAKQYDIIGLSKKQVASLREALVIEEEEEDSKYTTSANSEKKGKITPNRGTPPQKGSSRKGSTKKKYTADPKVGRGALEKANFTCENNKNHKSFIAKSTNKKYMEPHHLIPISKQGEHKKNIDITSNLICLCPQCHKQFHHGTNDEVKDLLKKFLRLRSSNLKQCEVEIDLETLMMYYNVD